MKYYEPIWNSGIFRNLWDMDDMDMSENLVFPQNGRFFFGEQIMLNHGILGYPYSDKPIWGEISEASEASVAPKNSQVNIVNIFI